MRASFLSASFQPQHLRASQPSHTMSFSDVCDASSRYFNANFIPLFSTLSSDEHDLAVARQEIIALKKKYSDLELLHQQVSTELQGREQQIEDLTIELHVRQQDLDETTIEVQDLRQLANQVASQLQGEIQESKDMSNSIDNYERERSEMIEEIYSLRSQNSSLQISNDRLTRMIGDAGSFFARVCFVIIFCHFIKTLINKYSNDTSRALRSSLLTHSHY